MFTILKYGESKGGSTLVTLPLNVTPYPDSVNGARDRVTYQKLVTRSRYGLVRCAVGIWLSHQRDDTLRGKESRSHCHDTVLSYAVTLQVWTHLKSTYVYSGVNKSLVYPERFVYTVLIY